LITTAEGHRIPYQKDVFKTWTDASTIHTAGKGIPCGGIFIPRCYSHAPVERVRGRDIEHSAELLRFFLKELRSDDIETLIRKV
jgi:putative aminopeptidase FrvX